MRDPIFYRYHTAVDQVFDVYKELLVPYQRDGVRIIYIAV